MSIGVTVVGAGIKDPTPNIQKLTAYFDQNKYFAKSFSFDIRDDEEIPLFQGSNYARLFHKSYALLGIISLYLSKFVSV